MCQRRGKKIVKGSLATRQREARRQQRLRLSRATSSDESNPAAPPAAPAPDKTEQNRVMLELAWKTVVLMHKNRLIQQKILDLQMETSEFITDVMSDPEAEVSRRELPPFLRELSYSELQSLRLPMHGRPAQAKRLQSHPAQIKYLESRPAQCDPQRLARERAAETLNVVD